MIAGVMPTMSPEYYRITFALHGPTLNGRLVMVRLVLGVVALRTILPMLASILIIPVSLLLLVYWLRSTCLLLLRNAGPAAAGENPQRVQEALSSGMLDPLHQELNQEYAVLRYLVRHAPALNLNPIEKHLLAIDFWMMHLCYRLTRNAAPGRARLALQEMATIIRFIGNRVHEQTATQG
jgi:hypothetical protein